MTAVQSAEIPFVALRPMLQQIARDYTSARSRSGIALLDAARHLAAARTAAAHGEWYIFLQTTATGEKDAERLLSIHAAAESNQDFREAIASNWMGARAAALMARLGEKDPELLAGLLAQPMPPTTRQLEAALKSDRAVGFASEAEALEAARKPAELITRIAGLYDRVRLGQVDKVDDMALAYSLNDQFLALESVYPEETAEQLHRQIDAILDALEALPDLKPTAAPVEPEENEAELLAQLDELREAEAAQAPQLDPALIERVEDAGWTFEGKVECFNGEWCWWVRTPRGTFLWKSRDGLESIVPAALDRWLPGPLEAGLGVLERHIAENRIEAEDIPWLAELRTKIAAARDRTDPEIWQRGMDRIAAIAQAFQASPPPPAAAAEPSPWPDERWPHWRRLQDAVSDTPIVFGAYGVERFRLEAGPGADEEFFPATETGYQQMIRRIAHLTGDATLLSLISAAPVTDMPALIARARAAGAVAFWSSGTYSMSATPHHPGYHGPDAQGLRDAISALEAALRAVEPAGDISEALEAVERAQDVGQWAELVDKIDALLEEVAPQLASRDWAGMGSREAREAVNLLAAAADALRMEAAR